MYKICRSAKSRERQLHIAMTLVDMLAEQRFREVQISDLCRKAEIPRKAFYRYFDTKEDVISCLAEHALDESSDGRDMVEQGLKYGEGMGVHIFRYWKEHQELFNALTDQDALGIFVTTYMRMIITNELGLNRVAPGHESRQAVALFAAHGFIALLLQWKYSGFQRSPEELGRMFNQILTQPMYQ